MAFRIKHGSVDAVTQLATLAGEAKKSQRQQDIAIRFALAARAEANRREMAEFQAKLSMDKQKQAMAWDVQKMQIMAENKLNMAMTLDNMDTQRKYDDQVRQMQELEVQDKAIDKADWVTYEEKERFKFNAKSRIMGLPEVRQPRQTKDDSILSILRGRLEGTADGSPSPDQLRKAGTPEAYEEGKRLGYWE